MTDECLASSGAAKAALTRTVTGAILAPYETQRLVVSGKTGIYSSATPGKDSYVPVDPGGEMVTPVFRRMTRHADLLTQSVHYSISVAMPFPANQRINRATVTYLAPVPR